MTPYTLSPPMSEDRFEDLCLEVMRQHWSRLGLQRFGKRGERQYGIDLLDTWAEDPVYAAQCKLKEVWKNLQPHEIEEEVDKAKTFPGALDHYAILTTAKISTEAQLTVQKINKAHKEQGRFRVEIITWDRLSAMVRKYPSIENEFYGGFRPEEVARFESKIDLIITRTEADSSSVSSEAIEIAIAATDAIDIAINEARDHVKPHSAQLAVFLLNRILQTKGGHLSDWQRFRVLTNLGLASLNLEKAIDAARFFLDAKPLAPEDGVACAHEVLARHLLGEDDEAHRLADDYAQRFPLQPRIRSLWIQSAPMCTPYEELLDHTPAALRSDSETALALARRAMVFGNVEAATNHARDATITKPGWFQGWLQLAQITFAKVVLAVRSLEPLTAAERTAALATSQAAAEEAFRRAESDGLAWEKSQVRVLQTDLALTMGRQEEAGRFAHEAYALDPNSQMAQLAVAQVAGSKGDFDEAIRVLEEVYAKADRTANVSYMLGRALLARGTSDDNARASHVFREARIAELGPELADPIIIGTVRALTRTANYAEVDAYMNSVVPSPGLMLRHTVTAFVLFKRNDQQAARNGLELALQSRTGAEPAGTLDLLARTLCEVGMFAASLPILQELFHAEREEFDTDLLLRCASELGRDDVVLQVCEAFWLRGVPDWQLVEFESQYLEEYDFPKAIMRLQRFVGAQPQHRVARLRLSIAALRFGQQDLIDVSEAALPSPESLPLRYAMAVVHLLQTTNQGRFAVEYAYNLLRARPDELEAHKAYIASLLPMSCPIDIPVSMDTVEVNSAVEYAEIGDTPAGWFVIEETTSPKDAFEEISADSALAAALLGKRIGETFVLAKSPVLKDRTGKVLRILSKYTRRFQACSHEMQIKFGDQSVIQTLHMPAGDQLKAEDLQPILNAVKAKGEASKQLREMYKTSVVSLHLFGERLGHNAFDAVVALASSETDIIRCALPQVEHVSNALKELENATGLVLEMSALSTLRLLGLTRRVLAAASVPCFITSATFETLQRERLQMRWRPSHGTLVYQDGEHVLSETSQEQADKQSAAFEEWMHLLETHAKIVPVPALAAVEPTKRDIVEKVFGKYGAEAALLASTPGYMLYTDDLVLAEFAKSEWATARIWTQAYLESQALKGELARDTVDEACAKLVGFGYQATHWSGQVLIAALRATSGSFAAFPAKQMLEAFSGVYQEDPAVSLQLLAQCVLKLFSEPFLPETRFVVLQTLLDTYPDDGNTRSILGRFRDQCTALFGINSASADAFRRIFDRWQQQSYKLKLL